MEIEFDDKDVENKELKKAVDKDTALKEWLVDYVGTNTDPEDGNVTVEMIIEQVARDFPEFLLAVAEENFIRGYEQALNDVEVGQSILEFKK
jgi:hypothetical protein|tara:strand:- start:3731 stop:4006 length:276 start_codon:yes stop_codon:yes gene_type:complete